MLGNGVKLARNFYSFTPSFLSSSCSRSLLPLCTAPSSASRCPAAPASLPCHCHPQLRIVPSAGCRALRCAGRRRAPAECRGPVAPPDRGPCRVSTGRSRALIRGPRRRARMTRVGPQLVPCLRQSVQSGPSTRAPSQRGSNIRSCHLNPKPIAPLES